MRVVGCILAGAMVFGPVSPAAADFPFQSKDIASVLNAAAEKIGIMSRFEIGECGENVNVTCSFTGRSVGGVATGALGSPAHEVTVIYAPGQGPASDAILAWGVMIAALNPEADASARGSVLIALTDAVLQRGVEREEVVLGRVRYTMLYSEMVGIWLIGEFAGK